MIEYESWDFPVEEPSDEELKARRDQEWQQEIDGLKETALKAIRELTYLGGGAKPALEEVAAAATREIAQLAEPTQFAKQKSVEEMMAEVIAKYKLGIDAQKQQ